VRASAAPAGREPEDWATGHDLDRYSGSSLKGAASIDWDNPEARGASLQGAVADADADRLLGVAREVLERIPSDDPEHRRPREAAGLPIQLPLQGDERRADGAGLGRGVSPDRIVPAHDPEMRHGRESATKRFDGHKGAIAVDPESRLITAAGVLPGNARDRERAPGLVEEAVGDCAYGDSETRQAFADAGRKLVAKVPNRRGQAQFPKGDFRIDLEAMACVCPAGRETRKVVSISSGDRYGAPGVPLRALSLRRRRLRRLSVTPFVRARPGKGRMVMPRPPHPREASLRRAGQDALPAPDGRRRREPDPCSHQRRPHARPQPPGAESPHPNRRPARDANRPRPPTRSPTCPPKTRRHRSDSGYRPRF
jgi:hypothetical protein